MIGAVCLNVTEQYTVTPYTYSKLNFIDVIFNNKDSLLRSR
jgi:hypothetical protein